MYEILKQDNGTFNLDANGEHLGNFASYEDAEKAKTIAESHVPDSPVENAHYEHNGSSTDNWGATLTPAIVNDPTFGFAVATRTWVDDGEGLEYPGTTDDYHSGDSPVVMTLEERLDAILRYLAQVHGFHFPPELAAKD